jgi:hypothetical protein
LLYHTFGFTGNPWTDTILLSALQLTIPTMVSTGRMMAFRNHTKKSDEMDAYAPLVGCPLLRRFQ